MFPPNSFVSISSSSKVRVFLLHQSFEALSIASSSQASTSITIDELHPFFLHHAENLGVILVSQPLTGDENYPTWARSMGRALRIKSKFWLIDGSVSLTSAMEKVPILIQSWA